MAKQLPKISIVTPSYNQERFLEETILSVISQDYPNIEYVIIDGASTDGSVEIIRKYEDKLAFWVSEPDDGAVYAINKGFSKTTGDIMAILPSSDKYTPWALSVVGEIFSIFSDVDWLTTLYPLLWDEYGRAVACVYKDGFSPLGFLRGEYMSRVGWYATGFIQAESTFWRRSLWELAGGDYGKLHYAADFELWARFFQYTELYGVMTPLGGFRAHGKQLSADYADEYIKSAKEILHQYGGRPYSRLESFIRLRLLKYMPLRLRSLAVRLGLLDSYKVCKYAGRGGGWKIVEL